jgi:diguanylate cyclase (GGDEF)-like protein
VATASRSLRQNIKAAAANSQDRNPQLGPGAADEPIVSGFSGAGPGRPDHLAVPGLEVGDELGRGARSVVYRASRDGVDYAMKVLTDVRDEREQVDFRREAALLAGLDHPGLPRVHHAGTASGRPYLVMELLAGQSLRDLLRSGPLGEVRAVELATEIADALGAAHRAGLVHRDIKPDNIMIMSDGSARVIDFGLAGRAGQVAGSTAVGTFTYSAPEQTGMLRRPVDGRADLYALGVMLFEGLTGAPPFHSDDPGELIWLHMSAPPPPLSGVSAAVAEVVGALLAKDPDDRYRSADHLRADLARVAAGERPTLARASAEPAPDAALVGRAEELAHLLKLYHDAAAGNGSAALVAGPSGIGKSRLAREVTAMARSDGLLVLHGTCERDSAVPLSALRDALERHLQAVEALPVPAKDTAVQRVREAAGGAAALLRPLSSVLAGYLPSGDHRAAGDDQQFAEAVAGLLANLARAYGGAVLHVDDVQWCDDATRRVLRRLGPLLAQTPLLVVVTGREDGEWTPEPVATDLDGALRYRVELGPLDDGSVAALVAGHFGASPAPAELVGRLATRTGGNPQAVTEYLRAVLDAGLVRPSWGTWLLDAAGLDALALPDNVMDLVLRRVEELDGPDRRLLAAAAAAGARFTTALLAAAGQVDEAVADAAVTTAGEHRLAEAAGDGRYSFVNNDVRAALLAGLDDAGRRAIHHRIARWLDGRGGTGTDDVYEVVRHYLLAGPDAAPEDVVRAAGAAGARALDEHASAEAFAVLSQAATVAASSGTPTDAAFHANLGRAAVRVTEYETAHEHLRIAADLETEPMRRARIYGWLADAHHLRWEGVRGFEMVRLAHAELGEPLSRNTLVLALSSLVRFLAGVLLGRLPERLRVVTGARRERYELLCHLADVGAKCLAMAQRVPMMTLLAMRATLALARLGRGPEYARHLAASAITASAMGRTARTRGKVSQAVALAESLDDPAVLALVQWMCGIAVDLTPPMATTDGQRMRHAIDDHGRWLALDEYLTGVGALGMTAVARGYPGQAEEWYQRGLSRTPRAGEALGNVFSTLGAQAAAMTGRPAEAATKLREIREYLHETPDNLTQRISLAVATANVAVELGDLDEMLEQAIADFAATGIKPAMLWSYQMTFWLSQAFGRLAQAHAAPPERRAERLATAERAVADLRRVARGAVLRAFHHAAVGELKRLRGDDSGALDALVAAQQRGSGYDVPMLEYEIARTRARIFRRLGRSADAHRQAGYALLLATEHGWVNRATWIRREFGFNTVTASRGMRTPRPSGTVSDYSNQRRLAAVHDVSRAAATVLEPRQLTRLALDEMVRIFAAERAFVFLVDEARADAALLAPYLGRDSTGADLDQLTGYGSTLVDRVHLTGEALVITGSDEGAALGSQSTLVHGLRSIMVAPLTVSGRGVGVVYLDSRAAKGIFTPDDVDLLAAIANHVALSLETARAAQLELAVNAAQRERDTAQLLHQAMTQLTASLDPDQVAERLAGSVARLLRTDTVILLHRQADAGLAITAPGSLAAGAAPAGAAPAGAAPAGAAPAGAAPAGAFARRRIRPGGEAALAGLLGAAATNRGTGADLPQPLADLLDELDLAQRPGHDHVSWLAVPLTVRGEHRGLLFAVCADRLCTETDAELATAMAGQGMTALDNAVLFRQVQELATRDGLTGLFNRRHFLELAERQVQAPARRPVAAVMVDIDHFKAINDTHGHAVGDEVIREVAHRLSTVLRESDVICRYGGEEFAVLLSASPEQARVAADRLHAAISAAPVETLAGPLHVTVSVGLTEGADDPTAVDLSALLHHADNALYQAKQGGRNRVARGRT